MIKTYRNIKIPFKVLLSGSIYFENKNKIKSFLFDMLNNFSSHNKDENTIPKFLYIATRGNNKGADKYIKEYIKFIDTDFKCEFGEFLPYYEQHTNDCIAPSYRFNINCVCDDNKKIAMNYTRNSDAVKWADIVILFIDDSISEDKEIEFIIKECNRLKKSCNIIKN